MMEGLRNITHYDVVRDMTHDGYGVEQTTMDLVTQYSRPSPLLKDLFY
jgi:hypothetical protein